ncbi:MAG: glycosyltransferase family 2 protein [Candidatus Microgenomates bacterium]
MQKVIIIIPTYNESNNVALVTAALAKVFKKINNYQCLILFVDDQSPDGTGKTIKGLMKKFPFVKLLENKRKSGLGHAYKKGMIYALDKLKADIVFEFDADLQHDPSRITTMLKGLEAGSDLVLGSRYIKGGGIPRSWGFHRKFLSIVGNLFIRLIMLNNHIHDWTTGFRAIKKEVIRSVLPELSEKKFSGYTFQIGFLVKTLQHHYTVSEVPFVFRDRKQGESKLGPEYIINTLRYIMKLRLNQLLHSRLLKFVTVGGSGAAIQFISLHFYRQVISFQLAFFLAIETAILSNFIWNNAWTFKDRKLKPTQIPGKFLQFNLASGGSILIQQTIAFLGERFIGLYTLFGIPSTPYTIDTGAMFAVTGILIGMFWNFFAYSHIVWKNSKV